MPKRTYITYIADFETTTDRDDRAEVWAANYKEYGADQVSHKNNIKDFVEYFYDLDENSLIYLHNLKFDGAFIIDYLLRHGYTWHKTKPSLMSPREFKATISSAGLWYMIIIKKRNNKIIEVRDSLKLLPMSLKKISTRMNVKHKKKKMDFSGRGASGPVSEGDREYMDEDVNALEEGLGALFEKGVTEMTIGVCCYNDFVYRTFKAPDAPYVYIPDFGDFYPDLRQAPLPPKIWDPADEKKILTAEGFCRSALRGGWCYLKPGVAGVTVHGGRTYDNNSLYTSQMHSQSGNAYPIGWPRWFAAPEFDKVRESGKIYYVRFRAYFKVKPGRLPFVQVKDSYLYDGAEVLESSDVTLADKKKHKFYVTLQGDRVKARPWLTMCKPDFELFLRQYDVEDLEVNCGCTFWGIVGLYDRYIDHWMGIKMDSTGAKRTVAKLFLENLFGQLCRADNSSYKIPYLNAAGEVAFKTVYENNRKVFYIAAGAMVTAYGRQVEISAAQENIDIFLYGDTDSIHVSDAAPVKGIKIHPARQGEWKEEARWEKGKYVRPKTYIELLTAKDGVELSEPEYNIKCAGMGDQLKKYFTIGLLGEGAIPADMPAAEKRHLYGKDGKFINRSWDDFGVGLRLTGKLVAHRVTGGIRLIETDFVIRERGHRHDGKAYK